MGLIFTKGQIDDFRQFSIEVQAAKMNDFWQAGDEPARKLHTFKPSSNIFKLGPVCLYWAVFVSSQT
jgi:hypothetical protein